MMLHHRDSRGSEHDDGQSQANEHHVRQKNHVEMARAESQPVRWRAGDSDFTAADGIVQTCVSVDIRFSFVGRSK